MTAPDLSPAELAEVERFEQAPDALAEVALTDEQYRTFAGALCSWWDGQGEAEAGHVDDDARPCGACGEEADALAPVVARMVAEAAHAREAEVRAGSERHKDALFERGERWKARAEKAEAETMNTTHDYDRRGERLWRLAAKAGWMPGNPADNDHTAELFVSDALDAAAAVRERVAAVGRDMEKWYGRDGFPAREIRAALAPADNDGEARPQQPPDATPYLPPLPDEIECCASGSCEVCRR